MNDAAHDRHARGIRPDPLDRAQSWPDMRIESPNAQFAGDGVFEPIAGRHLPEEPVLNPAQERDWFDDESGTLRWILSSQMASKTCANTPQISARAIIA